MLSKLFNTLKDVLFFTITLIILLIVMAAVVVIGNVFIFAASAVMAVWFTAYAFMTLFKAIRSI